MCGRIRSASPDSKRPVHWIMTNGDAPPMCSPAATVHASPSRQTRTSEMPARSIAGSQRPIVLSGTVTTCETPTEVKSAVTGYGRAEKMQVQQMVRALLKLTETPEPYDASDALAVAICHVHTYRFHKSVAHI